MPTDHPKYPGVPIDFPVNPIQAALTGAQPKVNLVEEDGYCYASGTAPSEVSEIFQTCEDLAQQFVAYCREKESSGFGTHIQILECMHSSLLTKDWCTPAQYDWIVRRTAHLLKWQVMS